MARTKKAINYAQMDGSDSELDVLLANDDGSASESEAPKRKKAKTTAAAKGKGKARGRQGKLAAFANMPLDVLSEICSHLDPLTLLYLGRCCKSLRAFFMSKSARALWVTAFDNVAFPDLEAPDWSEPAIASLVFERLCDVCGKKNAKSASYHLRVRYCKPCQKASLSEPNAIRRMYSKRAFHPKVFEACRSTPVSYSGTYNLGRPKYWLPEVLAKNEWMLEFDPLPLPPSPKAKKKPDKAAFFKKRKRADTPEEADDEPDTYQEERTKLVNDFVQRRLAAKPFAMKDSNAIWRWEQASHKDRKAEADEASQRRRAASVPLPFSCMARRRISSQHSVVEKLVALGYDPRDIDRASYAYSHGRDLTPRIWNSIQASVIGVVENRREQRLASEAASRRREREHLLTPLWLEYRAKYCKTDEARAVFPAERSFALFDSVKPFWYEEDAVIDLTLWSEAADAIARDVEAFVAREKKACYTRIAKAWVASKVPELAKAVDAVEDHEGVFKAPDTDAVDDAQMDAVFRHSAASLKCVSCQVRLNYPLAFGHKCTFWRNMDEMTSHGVRATYLAATAAGLDPATVSALELASLKTKNLECVDCGLVTWDSLLWRNVPAKIGPQTWSEMMAHCTRHYGGNENRHIEVCEPPVPVDEAAEVGPAPVETA